MRSFSRVVRKKDYFDLYIIWGGEGILALSDTKYFISIQ